MKLPLLSSTREIGDISMREGDWMNPLQELLKISHLIPRFAMDDIEKRIGDWLASGGKVDDPYIEQQLKYARRFVKDV